MENLDIELAKELNKEIYKQRKREVRIKKLESVREDLDVRTKWLGIRYMKKEHKPIPYALRKAEGKRKINVKQSEKAETAAQHLEEIFWGLENKGAEKTEDKKERIIKANYKYQTEEITLEELRETIKKFKRRKATGPDELPMEAFKEMDDENMILFTELLNKWWNEEDIPEEVLEARIVLS